MGTLTGLVGLNGLPFISDIVGRVDMGAFPAVPNRTTLTSVPAKAFTRKHYSDLIDEIREEVRAEQEAIGGLDEKGRANRDFEVAQRMLNELESNLGPTNYAKTMDARERLDKARKERDHHYYMEIVKKAWAEFNDRKLSRH